MIVRPNEQVIVGILDESSTNNNNTNTNNGSRLWCGVSSSRPESDLGVVTTHHPLSVTGSAPPYRMQRVRDAANKCHLHK